MNRSKQMLVFAAAATLLAGCTTEHGPIRVLSDLPMAMARGTIANLNDEQFRREGVRADEFEWEQHAGATSESWDRWRQEDQ
ncbi:MAG: hypothetical protein AAF589_06400 [Planctomycetota bacterium]